MNKKPTSTLDYELKQRAKYQRRERARKDKHREPSYNPLTWETDGPVSGNDKWSDQHWTAKGLGGLIYRIERQVVHRSRYWPKHFTYNPEFFSGPVWGANFQPQEDLGRAMMQCQTLHNITCDIRAGAK